MIIILFLDLLNNHVLDSFSQDRKLTKTALSKRAIFMNYQLLLQPNGDSSHLLLQFDWWFMWLAFFASSMWPSKDVLLLMGLWVSEEMWKIFSKELSNSNKEGVHVTLLQIFLWIVISSDAPCVRLSRRHHLLHNSSSRTAVPEFFSFPWSSRFLVVCKWTVSPYFVWDLCGLPSKTSSSEALG